MHKLLHKLWLYNDWSTITLINSLLSQQAEMVIPDKSKRLMSHIITTQTIWLDRIKGIKPSVEIWAQYDLETCLQLHRQSSAGIKEQIDQYATLAQQNIHYTNSQGTAYENQTEDILLHIFNHGSYHRGQIAQDLRLNGLQPINTDYITFVR